MEIKKTRNELIAWANQLGALDLQGFKVCYAVARTMDKLQEELKAVRTALEPMAEYNKLRDEIAQDCAAKDDNGNPRRTETGYILADLKGYNKKLEALDKKHQKAIDERDAFFAEEVTVNVHGVDESDVPDDITMAQTRALLPLIKQKE